VYYVARYSFGQQAALVSLLLSSLFFYGYSVPIYLPMIIGSYMINYIGARFLTKTGSRLLLTLMITLNLGFLGFFKYFNFFIENTEALTGFEFATIHVALPLGISFYTFQQIPYLVDAYHGRLEHLSFLRYVVVNSFYPHLIAGPIIWHREIAPQLERSRHEPFDAAMASLGLTIFVIGLFKKVMVADSAAFLADAAFNASETGQALTFYEAWFGALSYSIQIYFDFSGYSEMAIGLALLYGIRFPINFFSPYKATSVIEFWKRWHMTMTRFFQEFVYVPIQMYFSRRSESVYLRYLAIMIMMSLVGFWHGAGWTWILWGGLHGLLLCGNHLWRGLRHAAGFPYDPNSSGGPIGRVFSWALTFACVTAAWVLFRAKTFGGAAAMYKAMFLGNGIAFDRSFVEVWGDGWTKLIHSMGIGLSDNAIFGVLAARTSNYQILFLLLSILFVAIAPNTLQVMRYYSNGRTMKAFGGKADAIMNWVPRVARKPWRPSLGRAAVVGLLFVAALTTVLDDPSRSVFIYFNF
jgi:D-alanyl-lipoteichoic acid acyltransferase DltB (MBOAT superfamily)